MEGFFFFFFLMLFFSVKAGVDFWALPEGDTCGGLTADAATDIRAEKIQSDLTGSELV